MEGWDNPVPTSAPGLSESPEANDLLALHLSFCKRATCFSSANRFEISQWRGQGVTRRPW